MVTNNKYEFILIRLKTLIKSNALKKKQDF